MCMRLRHRLAVHLRDARQREQRLRRRPQLSPHAPRGHLAVPLLVGDPVRPPDALHAPDRAHLPRSAASPAPVETNPDGTTDRPQLRAHRPDGKDSNWLETVPARAGGRSCGSTILSSHSSDLATMRDPTDLTGHTTDRETVVKIDVGGTQADEQASADVGRPLLYAGTRMPLLISCAARGIRARDAIRLARVLRWMGSPERRPG
jgi:hypothetical protein